MTTEVPTYVITPEAVLSYPHLFTARKNDKGEMKYEATFVFSPEQQKTPEFAKILEALQAAGLKKFGERFHQLLKTDGFKKGLRTDGEAKGYGAGSVYLSARTDTAPQIVGPDLKPITDKTKVYPGVICRASLRAFGFDGSSNKGVSFALQNVQIIRDGDRLDGKKDAADEFTPVAVEAKDLSALNALMGQ